MVHRREDAPRDWTERLRLIVFGHSHRPELEWRAAACCSTPAPAASAASTCRSPSPCVHVEGDRLAPEILPAE